MLAAVYHPGNNNLVLDKNYSLRSIGDDEILLKVSACGVCHTDVTVLTGASVDPRTYVFGHEISGVPVRSTYSYSLDYSNSEFQNRIGNEVAATIKLGKLFSVLSPDSCDHGVNGGPVFTNTLGLGFDGGYAEYVIVKAANLVPVPDGVSPEAAAVASDAGITAYNAVKYTAGVTKSTKVLIFGVGGLGHLAVQFARHLGATVYVCDFKPQARKLALDLGADGAFNLIELTNKTAAGFTVDTTIDFVANNQTFNLAMAALSGNDVNFPSRPKLVLAGVSAENLVFLTGNTIVSGVQILSSSYGPRSAAEEVLNLFAKV
ncbi:hypothetical protein C8R43DRAFT_1118226 [Mycena crocata]|nr:hypothetical protein C8R43DRAFT_1118226 [Mycena crocata]